MLAFLASAGLFVLILLASLVAYLLSDEWVTNGFVWALVGSGALMIALRMATVVSIKLSPGHDD